MKGLILAVVVFALMGGAMTPRGADLITWIMASFARRVCVLFLCFLALLVFMLR